MQRDSKFVSDEVGSASVVKKVMAILGHTIIIYFFITFFAGELYMKASTSENTPCKNKSSPLLLLLE